VDSSFAPIDWRKESDIQMNRKDTDAMLLSFRSGLLEMSIVTLKLDWSSSDPN